MEGRRPAVRLTLRQPRPWADQTIVIWRSRQAPGMITLYPNGKKPPVGIGQGSLLPRKGSIHGDTSNHRFLLEGDLPLAREAADTPAYNDIATGRVQMIEDALDLDTASQIPDCPIHNPIEPETPSLVNGNIPVRDAVKIKHTAL
jgi:hypothetical protein